MTIPREIQLLVLKQLQLIDPVPKNAFSSRKISGNAALFYVSKQMKDLAACSSLDLIKEQLKTNKLNCKKTKYLLNNALRFGILESLEPLLVRQICAHIKSGQVFNHELDSFAVHSHPDIKKAAIRQIITEMYRYGAGITHQRHEVPEIREAARQYLESFN